MAIYKLIQNAPLGPDEIQRLVAAYEGTLRTLGLKERDDLGPVPPCGDGYVWRSRYRVCFQK